MPKARPYDDLSEQRFLIPPNIINDPLPKHVMVFASGINGLADLDAAVAARIPVGVDVSRISQTVIVKICASNIPVSLDSVAFREASAG